VAETVLTDTWLYETLTGDATLVGLLSDGVDGVVADEAEDDTTDPFVIFQLLDSADVYAIGSVRVLTDATYAVQAVDEVGSYVSLGPIADRIDALLHDKTEVVTGGLICATRRERPIRYPETTHGKTYRHLGGLYRIQVREEA